MIDIIRGSIAGLKVIIVEHKRGLNHDSDWTHQAILEKYTRDGEKYVKNLYLQEDWKEIKRIARCEDHHAVLAIDWLLKTPFICHFHNDALKMIRNLELKKFQHTLFTAIRDSNVQTPLANNPADRVVEFAKAKASKNITDLIILANDAFQDKDRVTCVKFCEYILEEYVKESNLALCKVLTDIDNFFTLSSLETGNSYGDDTYNEEKRGLILVNKAVLLAATDKGNRKFLAESDLWKIKILKIKQIYRRDEEVLVAMLMCLDELLFNKNLQIGKYIQKDEIAVFFAILLQDNSLEITKLLFSISNNLSPSKELLSFLETDKKISVYVSVFRKFRKDKDFTILACEFFKNLAKNSESLRDIMKATGVAEDIKNIEVGETTLVKTAALKLLS